MNVVETGILRGAGAWLGRSWRGGQGHRSGRGWEASRRATSGNHTRNLSLYFSFIIIIFCERQEEGWISGVILEGTELLFEVIIKK